MSIASHQGATNQAGSSYSFVGGLYTKRWLVCIAVLTAATNILYLTGSFFMLEVYDRVIPSHSIPTLIGLCVIAAVLYLFQGIIDVVRGRAMLRIGTAFDASLGPKL